MDAVGTDQTRLTHRAATVNAYDAGVRGVMYHRYYPPPHRYPYNTEDTDRMRLAAYPDLLAHKDKTFYVGPGFDRRDAISFGLTDQLPHELTAGEQGPDITIDVSDDIAAKSEAGELWRCELRIMLHELVHHDEYRVYWNCEEVPESKIRKADWVFQMRPSAGVRGYRLHIDLRNVSLPIKGTNTVRVDLITKDEQLVDPVSIHDIDIVVEYLPHRNALRDERVVRRSVHTVHAVGAYRRGDIENARTNLARP